MLMSAKYRMEANYAIKYYNKKEYTLAHIHTYSTYNIEAIQAVYIYKTVSIQYKCTCSYLLISVEEEDCRECRTKAQFNVFTYFYNTQSQRIT